MTMEPNKRILVIDDNEWIHGDFQKILSATDSAGGDLDAAETALFGDSAPCATCVATFEVDSALQGQEGYERARNACQSGKPYAMAFVDMRMPPGWDGVETIEHLWKADPNLQVVVCTAYSDQSWKEIVQRLGQTDQLLLLKKPFDNAEVWQMACAMTEKWRLARQAQSNLSDLETMVEKRTSDLETTNQTLTYLNARLSSIASELKGLMERITLEKDYSVRFANESLARCWEVKDCEQENCPAYGCSENQRCWEIAGTILRGKRQGTFSQKLETCRECEVYEHARVDPINDLGETFNDMIATLHERQIALEGALQASEVATKTKSDFLANMSHEIRTPMTAILGFAELLLEDDNYTDAPTERIDAVETIRRNGEHLLAIINDILDISKIEAGKMSVENISCSLREMIADVTSLVRVPAEAKGLPISIEYSTAVPDTIRTDPTRLRQILINLITNAIKFTEAGEVRLVTRFLDEGREPMLCFDVVDTGQGMTEEQVATLFQPFSQGDSSTTRKFGGTGLGLSISKRLAEMLGGHVSVVKTEPGIGTRLRVTVPTGPFDGVKMLKNPTSAAAMATDNTAVPESSS